MARHSPAQPILCQRWLFELSSHGLGDEWPPLPEKERKKGAWEPSEDQYERTRGPASHVKNLDPASHPSLCPHSLSLLSPASLTDKPVGSSGREAKVMGGGPLCVYVWVHVYLHEVCQQLSRGAGMSANSRSRWRRAHSSHNSADLSSVDALKGATL